MTVWLLGKMNCACELAGPPAFQFAWVSARFMLAAATVAHINGALVSFSRA